MAAPALRLRAPQLLYPKPRTRPDSRVGSGWLAHRDRRHARRAFGGDAGKLLDNMLRAINPHLPPRAPLPACWNALHPGARTSTPRRQADLAQPWPRQTTLQPALVLILGLAQPAPPWPHREPLGRLRAVPHILANGRPAVVTTTRPPAAVPRRQSLRLGRPKPCTGAGAQGRVRRIPRG